MNKNFINKKNIIILKQPKINSWENKLFLLLILSNLSILLLNENAILFMNYQILLSFFIFYLIKIQNNVIEKIEYENIEFSEILINYIRIKYQLLLNIKFLLNKIVELCIFIDLKFKYFINYKIKNKINNNELLYKNYIKNNIFYKLEKLVNIKHKILEKHIDKYNNGLRLYNIFDFKLSKKYNNYIFYSSNNKIFWNNYIVLNKKLYNISNFKNKSN